MREYPEELVNGPESRSRMLTLEDSELLPKGQILQEQSLSGTADANEGSHAEPERLQHGGDLQQINR